MRDQVRQAIDECERFIADRDDALALPREAAEFLHAMVLATGARRVLEIGTSYGYSGLWIGAAIQCVGGTLATIDISAPKLTVAQSFFDTAGFTDVITCCCGSAAEIIESLSGPFDFVLNDADKENCLAYARMVLPKLSRHGVILTDNTTSHRSELIEFLNWARSESQLTSVHIPIGNGMELSIKSQ